MKTHKELDAWKKAIEFVTRIYNVSTNFPSHELYGLSSQIRRADVSIPSNIAEGAVRKGNVEFTRFLYISLSSAAEVETQLIIAKNLQYIAELEYDILQKELESISKLIQGLIRYLKK